MIARQEGTPGGDGAGARAPGVADADAGDQASMTSTGNASTEGGPDAVASPRAGGPAGVLISADRYDLSDLAES